MAPKIDWPRAIFRGRYMIAVARMERNGIPVDAALHQQIGGKLGARSSATDRRCGSSISASTRTAHSGRRASGNIFRRRHSVAASPSGGADARRHRHSTSRRTPSATSIPLYELRATLSRLRLTDIPVGTDHRARCLLSPFQIGDRPQSTFEQQIHIRPGPVDTRLVGPPEGCALAYVDWSTQEIAIAAALERRRAHGRRTIYRRPLS